MGGFHEKPVSKTDTWLTPPWLLEALGEFDLDPCCPVDMPWATAAHCYTPLDNGLIQRWFGRVWLNPPYGRVVGAWLARMAEHGRGTALIFARTDTTSFIDHVWNAGSAALFIRGRLNFCDLTGKPAGNAGAASVLVAYGKDDADQLYASDIDGQFVALYSGSSVSGSYDITWLQLIKSEFRRNGSTMTLRALYAAIRRHPKAKRNKHWQAKARQQVQRQGHFKRTGRAQYSLEVS